MSHASANHWIAAIAAMLAFYGAAFAETGSLGVNSPTVWDIKLTPTWGVCGTGRLFASGTVEISPPGAATGKLVLYDRSEASFTTRLDEHHRLSTHFLSNESEGFQIEGTFLASREQGTWESGTASCGGEWQAEKIEK
jgi:hypothetical protein